IGPDPRNFNQRVSLGRNDLLIRTFPKDKRDATFKPDYLDGLVMHVEKGKVYLDGEFVNH
ncbi:hypothetical protein V7O29_12015, partial [Escherichia coli]